MDKALPTIDEIREEDAKNAELVKEGEYQQVDVQSRHFRIYY